MPSAFSVASFHTANPARALQLDTFFLGTSPRVKPKVVRNRKRPSFSWAEASSIGARCASDPLSATRKFVGTWLNDCKVFAADGSVTKAYKSEVTCTEEAGSFKIVSNQQLPDGNTMTVTFVGVPTEKDGQIVVEYKREGTHQVLMLSRQHSENTVINDVLSPATGQPMAVETITVYGDGVRVQSGQLIGPDGGFAGTW
eukprot:CAMPEP_0196663640 /NCGR_PEP_ID=MMETSP1086-20130531/53634_1 /TAXON_ID=77921 /ORGANISM="Cyanoptyche  gloeocystis , Strain SAG4.97" /LENGTH=198 /DNA_ID=CAMNT_0041999537 /DNA_START=32 /DNA_END=625 /DNA_ORIENTATION=-